MLKKFTKELQQEVLDTVSLKLESMGFNPKHIEDSDSVVFSFTKKTSYGECTISINYSKDWKCIGLADCFIKIYELEKLVSIICNISYQKIIKQHTYRYMCGYDNNYSKNLWYIHENQQKLDSDKDILPQDYVSGSIKYSILKIDNVGLPFLARIEENPYGFIEIEKNVDSKTVSGYSGLSTSPWEAWWIRKIIAAYKNNQLDYAFQYLEDLKTEVIEYPNIDEDEVVYATEVYERVKLFITGTPIEKIGKMNALLPKYRQYFAKEEKEDDLFVEENADDNVDQFGIIDILGMYFINEYRSDFIEVYPKFRHDANDSDLTLEDILQETDNDLYYVANAEKNYTLVTFEQWSDSAMQKTYSSSLDAQQTVLSSLFPSADIVGITFQESTGGIGFVHLKGKEKIRGFYHIMGETKTDFGHIPEDDTIEKEDYFGKQEKAFERLFPHPINQKLLEQTVSILQKR